MHFLTIPYDYEYDIIFTYTRTRDTYRDENSLIR